MKKVKVFSASWCAPCKALKAKLTENNIDFEVIDIEDNDDLCKQFNIRSVPTTIVEGTEFRHVGAMSAEKWEEFMSTIAQC